MKFVHFMAMVLVLVVGCVALIIFYYDFYYDLPMREARWIPGYRNAQNLHIGSGGTPAGTENNAIISFDSGDTRESIVSFYREQLLKVGWRYQCNDGWFWFFKKQASLGALDLALNIGEWAPADDDGERQSMRVVGLRIERANIGAASNVICAHQEQAR